MPNLRQSVIEDFWQRKDPRMARILGWMESMEDWMLDDNEDVASSIFALANTLEKVSGKEVVTNADDLLKAMAYMSSPRALRLMNWLEEHFPQGVTVSLTKHARENEDDETAALLLDRLNTLNRLSLLSKIFAPHRTKMIIDVLKDMEKMPDS